MPPLPASLSFYGLWYKALGHFGEKLLGSPEVPFLVFLDAVGCFPVMSEHHLPGLWVFWEHFPLPTLPVSCARSEARFLGRSSLSYKTETEWSQAIFISCFNFLPAKSQCSMFPYSSRSTVLIFPSPYPLPVTHRPPAELPSPRAI